MTKYISNENFQEIKSWVYRNARPLEYALWKYHFEGASKDVVLEALTYFQNDDGGFGKAVEPDNWNPNSTPYATDYVINILRQMDFTDITHPIYQSILRFLENTGHQGKDGWLFCIPTNNDFPHAVWWQYTGDEESKKQNVGITASLSGFILRYMDAGANLYSIALKNADMLIDKLKTGEDYGDMGVWGYCSLCKDLSEAGLGNRFDIGFLETETRNLIQKHVPEYKWTFHQDMAVAFPNPSIYYYEGYEQAVSDALDELIEIRPQNGVWDIPWEWYDDGKYTKEFAITENWWKSYKAIEKLLFIKAHGRLSEIN